MDKTIGKIPLEGLYNTRDLGGIETLDGRHIKSRRLIRSGVLTHATSHDVAVLVDDYDLRLIVDLRSGMEISETPDVCFPTVKTILNPIMDSGGNAIVHNRSHDINRIETLFGSFKSRGLTPEEYMMGLYADMVNRPYCQEQIGKFLKIIVNHEHGSTLWHCNEGKDRTGVCTAVLLSCLGVSRDVVVEDFHATGHFMHEKIKAEVKLYNLEEAFTPELEKVLYVLMTAKESYILSVFSAIDLYFGGFENYRRNQLGFSDAEVLKLRGMFLE